MILPGALSLRLLGSGDNDRWWQSETTRCHHSVVLTPPYSTEQSVAIAQNANELSDSAASRIASPVNDADRAKSPKHPVSKSGKDELPGGIQKSRPEGRPPVRIRRNPWQAMQQYLADGAGASRSTTSKDTASGSEPPSAAQSQAQRDAVVNPRDKALRPEDPSPPGEAVPSLLLRLSDPVPPASAPSRNPSSGVPDATRAHPPAHKDGKRISASEMIRRTRATSDKPTAAVVVGAAPSRISPSTASPVPVYRGGAVEQMSSENAAQPGGTTNAVGSGAQARYHASSTDPRSLLMQKLEAAKRDAADVPTAEKSQLSSAHRPSVPMALPHGRAGDPSKSAQDVETAERIAERREAELRIQAQLRVRLAAAKRTAQRSGELVESGTATSTATIDGDLAAQEVSLRDRLKSRQM
ncbi:hypothetical protein NUW54_g7942 [Trametes sanguinea]|uniref:Uncharacterized protein n=1 Tax=Trametes sanguinea TaxID=158606 RepID=A0ACC1PGT3_9APHY|nr:hypothetical protein NUW54_g7942 [Trametes sanguinea]